MPVPVESEWGASTFYDPVWNMVFSWGLGTPSNGTTRLAPTRRAAGPRGATRSSEQHLPAVAAPKVAHRRDSRFRYSDDDLHGPQLVRHACAEQVSWRVQNAEAPPWCSAGQELHGAAHRQGLGPEPRAHLVVAVHPRRRSRQARPPRLLGRQGHVASDVHTGAGRPVHLWIVNLAGKIPPSRTSFAAWLYWPPNHRECFSTLHRDRSDDFSYWYSRDVRTYDYHNGQTQYAEHPVAYTGKGFGQFYSGPEDTVNHVTAKMLNRPKGTINRNLFCVYWATEKGDVRAACKEGVEGDHWAGTRVDGHGLNAQLWDNMVHLTPGDEERGAAYRAINLNVLAYTKKSDRFQGNHVYTHVVFAGRLVCTFYAPTKEVHCAIWDDDREETNDLSDHFPGSNKAWHEESMPYGHRQHATSIGWYDSNGGTGHGDPETSDIFVFMWCRFSRCLPLYVDAAGRPTFLINGLVTKLSRMPANPDDFTSSSWRDKTFSVLFPDRMDAGAMRFDRVATSGGYMATYTLTPYGGKSGRLRRRLHRRQLPRPQKKPQHEKRRPRSTTTSTPAASSASSTSTTRACTTPTIPAFARS